MLINLTLVPLTEFSKAHWAMKPLSCEQVNFLGSCVTVKDSMNVINVYIYVVEHCTSIAEVVGSNAIEAIWVFRVSIRDNCLNCPHFKYIYLFHPFYYLGNSSNL